MFFEITNYKNNILKIQTFLSYDKLMDYNPICFLIYREETNQNKNLLQIQIDDDTLTII